MTNYNKDDNDDLNGWFFKHRILPVGAIILGIAIGGYFGISELTKTPQPPKEESKIEQIVKHEAPTYVIPKGETQKILFKKYPHDSLDAWNVNHKGKYKVGDTIKIGR